MGRWRESSSQTPDYEAGARSPEQHRHGRSTWSRTRIGRLMRPSGSPSPPAAMDRSPKGDRADSNRRSPGPRPGVHSVWTAVTMRGTHELVAPLLRRPPGSAELPSAPWRGAVVPLDHDRFIGPSLEPRLRRKDSNLRRRWVTATRSTTELLRTVRTGSRHAPGGRMPAFLVCCPPRAWRPTGRTGVRDSGPR